MPTTKPPPPTGPIPSSVLTEFSSTHGHAVAHQQQHHHHQQHQQQHHTPTFTPSSAMGSATAMPPPPLIPRSSSVSSPSQAQAQAQLHTTQGPDRSWLPTNTAAVASNASPPIPARPPKPDHLRQQKVGASAGAAPPSAPDEPAPPPRPPKKRAPPPIPGQPQQDEAHAPPAALMSAVAQKPPPPALPSVTLSDSDTVRRVSHPALLVAPPKAPTTAGSVSARPTPASTVPASHGGQDNSYLDVRSAIAAAASGAVESDVPGLLLANLDLVVSVSEALSNIIDEEEFAFAVASTFRDSFHESEFVRAILRRVLSQTNASLGSAHDADSSMGRRILRAYGRCVAGRFQRELVEGCTADLANTILGMCRDDNDAQTIARTCIMMLDAIVVNEGAVPGPVRRACSVAASLASPPPDGNSQAQSVASPIPARNTRQLSSAGLPPSQV
eukprot:Opistho-2@51344